MRCCNLTEPTSDRKELRQFGLLFSGIAAAIALALILLANLTIPIWVWLAIFLIALLAVVAARTLRQFYRLWLWLGHWLQWLNSTIVLALLFYLIITPTGLVMRVFGYDPMQLRRQTKTYRIPSEKRDPNHVEKPY